MKKTLLAALLSVGAFSTSVAFANHAQQTYYSENYIPLDQHRMSSKAVDGSSFEIEDKSQWKVSPQDQYKLEYWNGTDTLKIYPNNRCFRNTKYVVLNMNTREYACVELFLGPMSGLEHYKRIKAIDLQYGEVLVQNDNGLRSVWRVPSSEIAKLATWKINHTIIIGSNNPSWFGGSESNCILINVERNTYVPARQVE